MIARDASESEAPSGGSGWRAWSCQESAQTWMIPQNQSIVEVAVILTIISMEYEVTSLYGCEPRLMKISAKELNYRRQSNS